MMGQLHITTPLTRTPSMVGHPGFSLLSKQALRAGSSVATDASGWGTKEPADVGLAGSEIFTAWSPPECQAMNATSGRTVGLWVAKLTRSKVALRADPQKASWFSAILYSAAMNGCVGSEMFIVRAHPHGQPSVSAG